MSAASQRKRILHYLEERGSITSYEATHYLNVMSPRKRLSEINSITPLKKTVVLKKFETIEGRNKTIRYIRYSLA